MDEWDSDWEHTWEEEEDIYSSLEALYIVRFLHRGKYHNEIIEEVMKDIDGNVSGVTIRLLNCYNTMRHIMFTLGSKI